MKKVLSILILFFSLGINSVYSQTSPLYYDYSHNHLEWFTIEGEHFLIHFQEGNSRSAKVTARIAEEIYKPITELYQYEPDR